MLDIRFVRENPEVVKQNIKNKFQMAKLPLVDEVIDLDKENREIKQEVENLRAQRNKMSKQIGALMGQKKFEEAEAVKTLGKEGDIDKSYYRALVDKAVAFISEYGDFERFIADEPYTGTPGIDFPPDDDELPWYSNEELKEILKAQDEEQEDLFRKR